VNNLKIYYLQKGLVFRFLDTRIMQKLKIMMSKKILNRNPEELLKSKDKV